MKYTYIHRLMHVDQDDQHNRGRLRAAEEPQRFGEDELLRGDPQVLPKKRKLSETLAEIASAHPAQDASDLADEVEMASDELRSARMRAVDL